VPAYSGSVITSVVSADGVTDFYLSGGQFESTSISSPSPAAQAIGAGVQYFVPATSTITTLYSNSPVKALTIAPAAVAPGGANLLYMAKPWLDPVDDAAFILGQLGQQGAGLPTDATSATPVFNPYAVLPGQFQICQAVVQSSVSIWGAACGQVFSGTFYTGGLYNFRFNPATNAWPITTISPPSPGYGVRSIVYRNVSSIPTLFVVAEPITTGAATSIQLYSFNMNTNTYTLISTSATNTMYKSVSFAPFNINVNPTVSASPSPPNTPASTPSSSFTATYSVGASKLVTPSGIPSITPTNLPLASIPIPVGILPTSVLVVRIGDRVTQLNQPSGFIALPVFVDEILSNGYIRQTIALPQRSFTTNDNRLMRGCTLNADQYALEGQGSLSLDGKVFMFGEFDVRQ
jgi:hypothetical protein